MIADRMLRSSFVVFVFSFTASFFDYLYQVFVGRALGPSEYGVFASLFAVFYLLSIVAQTIGTSVTKFVASGEKLENFLYPALISFLKLSIIVSIVFIAVSPFLANFLRINDLRYFIVVAMLIVFTWTSAVLSGTLRGLEEYFKLGVIRLSVSLLKLIFGAIFVYLGYKSFGAILAVLLAVIFSSFLAFAYLRRYIKRTTRSLSSLYTYSLPVFLAMLLLSLPTNLDLIIVRRLFPEFSGIYASITVLGKIVYFFPAAIYVVLFPMAVKGNRVLFKSLAYTGLLSGTVVLVYLLYPNIAVFLFGEAYREALPYVFEYGLGILFFSLSAIFLYYSLATKNYGYIKFFMLHIFIYILMLLANDISDIFRIFVYGNFLLFATSLLFYSRVIMKSSKA